MARSKIILNLTQTARDGLIGAIDRFKKKRPEWTDVAIGRAALGNVSFVCRLRQGHVPKMDTYDKFAAWLTAQLKEK